jgi:hypothetical protein
VKLADGRSVSDLAKEHTATAIAALVEIISNKAGSASARVHAATALLDRGWGKPHQMLAANPNGSGVAVQALIEARARALELLDREYGSELCGNRS